ncbi:hypothetical protein CROQUDRAFT_653807 [Cronartium quercuum f. sp. fusiforme G11]|uniref:Galactose-1-phosphate uridylyltransferase n=1 Tax=Cronartium quercuum f. sp. fusiforme G11 TaxID=708437 RepID=A0A9P6NTL2_9BASI|nr:hypothetical protein CROQUDRAFT_653807 [Cronartium quercuum f. sp. fusiforme G11]
MEEFEPSEHSHRRYNPLTREWVLCSPHRAKRPWQGQTEPTNSVTIPAYDPKCYLCPGNIRVRGEQNDKYGGTFTFENDYAAITETEVSQKASVHETMRDSLYRTEMARGKCFVICFNPRHDLTIAELETKDILPIVDAWCHLYQKISREYAFVKYVQIFENKGAVMGCSNPHPHGQAWALSYIPTTAAKILGSQRAYAEEPVESKLENIPRLTDGRPCLLLAYAQAELKPERSPRVVYVSKYFLACVPYWALWPFEIMIIPQIHHIPSLFQLTADQREDLAQIIGVVTRLYDNLFKCSFPYSMGINQSPIQHDPTAQLHLSFYPPLLRSASVKKFQVGFEMFAESQRDLTPEQAAQALRAVLSEKHYKKQAL